MQKLIILGAGTFAMDVADLAGDTGQFEVAGFAVSVPPFQPGTTLLERPVYWVDDLKALVAEYVAVCAIVSTKRWRFTQHVAEQGMRFATVIHPSARVSRMATVGAGSIISAGALVSAHCQIGRHVIINRGALLGHHVRVQDHATISPGANLAGAVQVGERAWVGLSATVLEKCSIGRGALVGAASLVTHDVSERVQVMGAPARVVAENIEEY